MRENAEQRIVDSVGGAERELGEGRVFFIFGQLSLELKFLLVQFAIFVQTAKNFFLRLIAFTLQLMFLFRRLLQGFARSLPFNALKPPYDEHHHQRNESERKQVVRNRRIEAVYECTENVPEAARSVEEGPALCPMQMHPL
ncbi:MAG: hypothetical protein WBW53_13120 [Terriglobales bacterium]